MEIIDEVVPLTEKDIEILKKHQFSSTIGCAVICFIAVAILGFIAYQFFWGSYLLISIISTICLLLLLTGIGFLRAKKTENEQVTIDLKEGLKRRIVAPIEEKEIIDITRRPHPLNIKKQIIKSDQDVILKYFMYIQGFKFPISENQYLAGERKGDFMEFSVAPNSKIVISEPIAIKK
jgi:hypothetical protein